MFCLLGFCEELKPPILDKIKYYLKELWKAIIGKAGHYSDKEVYGNSKGEPGYIK